MAKRTLHGRLREARLAANAGYVTDVAAHTPVSVTALYEYESGETKPGIDALIALCKFYRVSSDWVLGLPEGRPTP